jgi:hypothetical protein
LKYSRLGQTKYLIGRGFLRRCQDSFQENNRRARQSLYSPRDDDDAVLIDIIAWNVISPNNETAIPEEFEIVNNLDSISTFIASSTEVDNTAGDEEGEEEQG